MEKNRLTQARRRFYRNNIIFNSSLLHAAEMTVNESQFVQSGVVEYVLSPLFVCFSIWILENAKKDGVKKLFFLSRDGYPFYKISKQLCGRVAPDIQCSYLHCSRYSLRVPMYSEDIEEALDLICSGGIDVTFRKIMYRSGFSDEEIVKIYSYFKDVDFDAVIRYSDLQKYKNLLRSCPEYIKALKHNSTIQWDALEKYFLQEGISSTDNVGIADSGWIGTTQKSICSIRRRCGCNGKVYGYYFGLFNNPEEDGDCIYRTFYFGKRDHLLNKVLFSNCLFEVISAADHGTVCGYWEDTNGIMKPSFSDYAVDPKKEKLFDAYKRFLNHFMKYATEEDYQILGPCAERFQMSLRRFMWEPTPEEADFFGSFKFSDDLLDRSCRELAPVFNNRYLWENHFWGRTFNSLGLRTRPLHESGWYEASAIRSVRNSALHRVSHSIYGLISFSLKSIGR